MADKAPAGFAPPPQRSFYVVEKDGEQLEFPFSPFAPKGIRSATLVKGPIRQKNRKEVETGNIIGVVNPDGYNRRKLLMNAAGYLTIRTVKEVQKWFEINSPEDRSNEALDRFLERFFLAQKIGMLNEFLLRKYTAEEIMAKAAPAK